MLSVEPASCTHHSIWKNPTPLCSWQDVDLSGQASQIFNIVWMGNIGCASCMFVCGGISAVHSRLLFISRMLWSSNRGPEVCRASDPLSHSSSSSQTVADLSSLYYSSVPLPSPHKHPQTSLWQYTVTLLYSIFWEYAQCQDCINWKS